MKKPRVNSITFRSYPPEYAGERTTVLNMEDDTEIIIRNDDELARALHKVHVPNGGPAYFLENLLREYGHDFTANVCEALLNRQNEEAETHICSTNTISEETGLCRVCGKSFRNAPKYPCIVHGTPLSIEMIQKGDTVAVRLFCDSCDQATRVLEFGKTKKMARPFESGFTYLTGKPR